MVTAAAGSVALVIGPTVEAHGVSYVLPIVTLAALIQVAFGMAGLARLIRFIPRSVMLGFVNALGVLIFCAQLPHVLQPSAAIFGLFLVTVLIVQLLPRVTRAVPSPLVAIIVVTAIARFAKLELPHVGGEHAMTSELPGLTPWLVPLSLQTLSIVWPAALSLAFVGLLESLLTAQLVDEMTESASDKSRESWALGVANLCAGWYGGIAGCAMIGQTVVNVQIGRARTRLSTVVAALVLLLLITALSELMAQIPMVSLAAVMMIVALKTISWPSVRWATLTRMPLAETSVMLLTVSVTVWTANLALGVLVGVMLAALLFARHVAHALRAERTLGEGDDEVQYAVFGPVFFASSQKLQDCFAYADDPLHVRVDFTHAQIWDATSVAALDAIAKRYRARGAMVAFTGLDARSQELQGRLSGRLAS
jgi:SulP family sulfate permease